MAYKIKFRCPEAACRHLFVLLMEVGDTLPDHCPKCGVFCGEDEDAPPNLVAIGGSDQARSINKMYKDVEETSLYRAEAAGDDSLKVTNMKDKIAVGETSLIPVRNIVTETAEQLQQVNGTKDAYFNSSIAQTISKAYVTPGSKKGVNIGLSAIQEKAMPNISTSTSPIALAAGFGGRR